jgi:ribosomal protein S27E
MTCPACESITLVMIRRSTGLEVYCGTCGDLVIDFEVAIARRRKGE